MEITILNTTSEIPVNVEIHKDTYKDTSYQI